MVDIHNYFFILLDFITGLVYLLVFKSILDNFSSKKFSNKIIYVFIFLTSIFIFIFKFENSIIFILLCVIFYKLNYKQDLLICILISLSYWILIYLPIEYISVDIVFNINYNELVHDFNIDYIVVDIENMIIQNILMLVVFQICIQIKKFKDFKYTYKKINYISIFLPTLINILMLIVIFRIIAIDKIVSKFYIIILIIVPILVIISKIYHFYMLKKHIYSYKLDYENKIIKHNVLKEHNYYKKINEEKDKVRYLHHDIKNHMICIKNLCEHKKFNKILEYIDSMEININTYCKFNHTFNTGNMILDSILREKKIICIEKGINFYVDMDFSNSDFMEMIDICTIFSNLIDNSIEACDKITSLDNPKKITLKSKYIDGFCIISIENTKVNEIKQIKNLFLTSKKNSYMHGIGLKNVNKSVEKYFGQINFNYYKNIFIVKIMIPCKR